MPVEKIRNTDNFYQTVNFLFSVLFEQPVPYKFPKTFTRGAQVTRDLMTERPLDICFQSVSGLDSDFETETVKEGGENHFEHVLPVRRKFGPLTLKRGLLTANESRITKWLKLAFDDHIVIPFASAQIKLLNEDHEPLMHWTINNVWPRSWKLGDLNAERGEVLIETLELNYNYLVLNND